MKLTRIKNRLLPKKREGSVSESRHDPERHGSMRSWTGRRGQQINSVSTPTIPTTQSSKVSPSSSKGSPALPPRPRQRPVSSSNDDNHSDESLENLSPEQKRLVFSKKLKNLSRNLIDDNQQVSVYATSSGAAPTRRDGLEPRDVQSSATPLAVSPDDTKCEVMSVQDRPKSLSRAYTAKMTRSRSDGQVPDLVPRKSSLFSSAFAGLPALPSLSMPNKSKAPPKTLDDHLAIMMLGEQHAYNTLEGCDTMESKGTFDSHTLESNTLDYTLDETFDQSVGGIMPDDTRGGRNAFSPSMETMGTGFYTAGGNQTQYAEMDGQNMTVCTDARTQVTAATESSQYTNRAWYDFLFTCGPITCGPTTAHDRATDDQQTFATIPEEGKAKPKRAEEEESKVPLNPCSAPYNSTRKTRTTGCVVPSDSRLAVFLSLSEGSEEKRSQHSPPSTRFAANDERQTSFASSSSSSSDASQTLTESTMSSYQKYANSKRHDPNCYHGGKPDKIDHASKQQHPVMIRTDSKKPDAYPDPYQNHAYEAKHTPLSNSPKKTRKKLGREIEFLTSDFGGRKSSIPLNTPVRTEPNWFLKRAAAGFLRRNKPVKAVEVPVRDEEHFDEHQEEDNSTISTKFSLMAMRR